MWSVQRPVLVVAAAALLCSCGGDDDDDDTPVTPPVQGQSITISGTVASGAAVSGATVDVKCATGTGSATSSANGSYQVTLTGTLPCVLRATRAGTVLHSVVEAGATLPTVANVTPLSDLLVAQLNGSAAAAMFDTFDATAQGKATASGVSAASGRVVTSLASKIDLSGDDLLKGTLVPATGTSSGNVLDQKLDALQLILKEANVSLAQLSAALVAQPNQLPPALANVAASDKHCPALRSGEFGGVEAENPEFGGDYATLDVTTRKISYAGEPDIETYEPVEGQPCQFKIGGEVAVVSPSGLIVSQFPENGIVKPAISVPKQEIAQADLAGDWNYVGWKGPVANFMPMNGVFTLDASGAKSKVKNYVGTVLNDESDTTTEAIVKNGTVGNYIATLGGQPTGRYFMPYRGLNGQLVLIGSPSDASQGIVIATKQAAGAVPAVGDKSRFWAFQLAPGGMIPLLDGQHQVTDVQATTVKQRRSALGDVAERIETVNWENPRTGFRYLATDACTAGDGTTPVNCAGWVQLPVPAAGLTVSVGLLSNSQVMLAFGKP